LTLSKALTTLSMQQMVMRFDRSYQDD
jgi:hypothetical protein